MVGAATAKLRKPKHVRTRGTDYRQQIRVGRMQTTRQHSIISPAIITNHSFPCRIGSDFTGQFAKFRSPWKTAVPGNAAQLTFIEVFVGSWWRDGGLVQRW